MVKDNSAGEETCCHLYMGYSFLINSKGSFTCTIPHTGQHLCYTNHGALAGKETAQWVYMCGLYHNTVPQSNISLPAGKKQLNRSTCVDCTTLYHRAISRSRPVRNSSIGLHVWTVPHCTTEQYLAPGR